MYYIDNYWVDQDIAFRETILFYCIKYVKNCKACLQDYNT